MQEKKNGSRADRGGDRGKGAPGVGEEVSLLLGKVAARPGLCQVEAVEGRSPPAVCCAGRRVDLVL